MTSSSAHERMIRKRLAAAASSRVHTYSPDRLRQLLTDARGLAQLLDQERTRIELVWVVQSALDEAGTDDVAVEAVFSDEHRAQGYVAEQGEWASLFWVEPHQVDPPLEFDDRVAALIVRASELVRDWPRLEHPRGRWFGYVLTLRLGKRIYSFTR